MKKITIYDLAELSGVSASAVSAILNGNWKKRRISAKLAEKVTRIAEEQGYAINRQASMLRSKKSHVIGKNCANADLNFQVWWLHVLRSKIHCTMSHLK